MVAREVTRVEIIIGTIIIVIIIMQRSLLSAAREQRSILGLSA